MTACHTLRDISKLLWTQTKYYTCTKLHTWIRQREEKLSKKQIMNALLCFFEWNCFIDRSMMFLIWPWLIRGETVMQNWTQNTVSTDVKIWVVDQNRGLNFERFSLALRFSTPLSVELLEHFTHSWSSSSYYFMLSKKGLTCIICIILR